MARFLPLAAAALFLLWGAPAAPEEKPGPGEPAVVTGQARVVEQLGEDFLQIGSYRIVDLSEDLRTLDGKMVRARGTAWLDDSGNWILKIEELEVLGPPPETR